MIYLDNAGTTKPLEVVSDKMAKIQQENFYNASATYDMARKSRDIINRAKDSLAKKLGTISSNIIFTSCATEANNQIINALVDSNKNSEYIFSEGEHPSVYNVGLQLKNKGKIVKFIPLNKDGKINEEKLLESVTENTKFVSIICVSNETGAINDIPRLVKLIKAKNKNVFVHSDCVQAFSKIDINVRKWDIDAITISAHKINGPKGIGALYVKNLNKLKPLLVGGGQENNLRSGTENIEAIAGFEVAINDIDLSYQSNILEMKQYIVNELTTKLKDDVILVSDDNCVPNIISVIFKNLKGEVFQHFLDQNGVMVGRGSACSSKKAGNRVLESMGYDKNEVIGNIRISLNKLNTMNEIVDATKIIIEKFLELKQRMSL